MNSKVNQTGLGFRLLQAAKDLVWQEDPAQARRARPLPAPATPANDSDAQQVVLSSAPAVVPNLALNPMAEELMRLIMNRPTAYSALGDAIAALQDIAMDEATRYRSAFAVIAKTQQRTAEQIAQAIDVHLSVLAAENERFAGQSKQAEEAEITQRQQQAQDLHSQIAADQRQIDKLRADTEALIRKIQDEVAHKQARASQLVQEAEDKQRAILQTTQQFENAIVQVKNRLEAERSKVQNYLLAA